MIHPDILILIQYCRGDFVLSENNIQSDTVYSLIPRDSYFIGNKYEMLYKSLIKKLFIIKSNLFLYCVPFYPR